MDDKRTLIAFLLVGVIFLVMPYYYEIMGIAQPRPVPESVADARQDSSESDRRTVEELADERPATRTEIAEESSRFAASSAPSVESMAAMAVVEAGAERTVEILTPLQRVLVSTAGGDIVSVQLLSYDRAHGGPVELLVDGGQGLVLSLESETGRGETLDLSQVHFEPDRASLSVEGDGQGELRLRADLGNGQAIVKTFIVHGDGYGIDVGIRLQGFDEGTVVFSHWNGGIALAERDPDLDLIAMKSAAYLNESLWDVQVDEDDELESVEERGDVRWVGVRSKYFTVLMSPSNEARHRVVLQGRPLSYEPFREYEVALGTRWGDVEDGEWQLLLYAGPLELEEMASYERDFPLAMDLGFPIIRDLAKFLLYVFAAGYQFIPNYGWVIVAFGVVVKILVYPLTHKSYESAAKMQEVQPKLMALREKHKNNNQKLSQETMKLYKEEGVNPLGGCLPMVFQMPIFFALYQVFSPSPLLLTSR